jgi:hypothetical protein
MCEDRRQEGQPPRQGPERQGHPQGDWCCDEHRREHEEREQHHHHHEGEPQDGCCCGSEPEGPQDPTEMMVGTWQRAFEQACHEVQVEILKERIRKAWGESMDSIADSVIDLMLKDWQSSQGQTEAREAKEKAYQTLVDKIMGAYKQGPK